MNLARICPAAIPLRDGRVLVVGSGQCTPDSPNGWPKVRPDSVRAEIYDPGKGPWTEIAPLPKPRAFFAAVTLLDGRVLVAGGLNDEGDAYSSTYLFDPARPEAGWVRSGLLGTARAEAAAAVLPDGRVLVAGGYYQQAGTGRTPDEPLAELAAFQPPVELDATDAGAVLADVGPDSYAPALATAELFDPVTGTWSRTGNLAYARFGSQAVTLADGRVLVVGSLDWRWTDWRSATGRDAVEADARAVRTAEIYDPATGRFSRAAEIPAIDLSGEPVDGNLVVEVTQQNRTDAVGTLVALADGGALLVERVVPTAVENPETRSSSGYLVASFRYDAVNDRWRQVEADAVATPWLTGDMSQSTNRTEHVPAMAVRLADGRVLAAGGADRVTTGLFVATRAARLYDPLLDQWSELPRMPASRAAGAAVALADGSALIVSGFDEYSDWAVEGLGPVGSPGAFRWVPADAGQ